MSVCVTMKREFTDLRELVTCRPSRELVYPHHCYTRWARSVRVSVWRRDGHVTWPLEVFCPSMFLSDTYCIILDTKLVRHDYDEIAIGRRGVVHLLVLLIYALIQDSKWVYKTFLETQLVTSTSEAPGLILQTTKNWPHLSMVKDLLACT